jgi:predicted  nucleic acid-binding Zn-ribbon protein
MKKLAKMETLHSRVATLESENGDLSTRLAVLTAEKEGLQTKEQGLVDRIHALEAQLAQALQIIGATR